MKVPAIIIAMMAAIAIGQTYTGPSVVYTTTNEHPVFTLTGERVWPESVCRKCGRQIKQEGSRSMKTYKRKAIWTSLRPYDCFAKEDDYIEVTEWANGEGYDINISRERGDLHISLTHGELQAVRVLTDIQLEDEQ